MVLGVKPIGCISFSYLLIVYCFFPLCLGLNDEVENPFIDCIIASIVLSVSSLVDALSYLSFNHSYGNRHIIKRNVESVNELFIELGPYYVRRFYRTREYDYFRHILVRINAFLNNDVEIAKFVHHVLMLIFKNND